MKSFQPKSEGAPPDDEGPDDPPTPSIDFDNQPTQSEPETEPMPRSNHRNRNAEVDFKGEKRSNATHASTTDPEARLYKKSPGTGAALCFMGHALMENRHGMIVQGDLTQAPSRQHAAHAPAGQWTVMRNDVPPWTWCIATPLDRPGS